MPMTEQEAKLNTAVVRRLRVKVARLEARNVDEFYEFASKIAKRDKWFIGGFLGAVYEEWQAKRG